MAMWVRVKHMGDQVFLFLILLDTVTLIPRKMIEQITPEIIPKLFKDKKVISGDHNILGIMPGQPQNLWWNNCMYES